MSNFKGYNLIEAARATGEWFGANTVALSKLTAGSNVVNPYRELLGAWGKLTEHSFARMAQKPQWDLDRISDATNGYEVEINQVHEHPFVNLIHFKAHNRPPKKTRILLIAPLSGHNATLITPTVTSLIPDGEIYVTDWKNARDVPVTDGAFDVTGFTRYLIEIFSFLGPNLNVVAICQPAPLALAATAIHAANDTPSQPKTLTLMGGPIDPKAAPSQATAYSDHLPLSQIKTTLIQEVSAPHKGEGRQVFPGIFQLSGFMSLNASNHINAFSSQVQRMVNGQSADDDKHNRFYDEYLATIDMPAEFYTSTIQEIFQKRSIIEGRFSVDGQAVDLSAINNTAVLTIEGADDDITPPGQCAAALALLTGLEPNKKMNYIQEDTGHYGLFAGSSWHQKIRPKLLNFIKTNS